MSFNEAEYERKRRDLVFACRSRVLTDEEMGEISRRGIELFTPRGWPYSEIELEKKFNEMLLQQFRIRGESARIRNQVLSLDWNFKLWDSDE